MATAVSPRVRVRSKKAKAKAETAERYFRIFSVNEDGTEKVADMFASEDSAAIYLRMSAEWNGFHYVARELDVSSVKLLPPAKARPVSPRLVARCEKRAADMRLKYGDRRTKEWQQEFGKGAKR